MKRVRAIGLLSGVIALIVCELPWVLALLGLGAASFNFEKLRIAVIEFIGFGLLGLSFALWIYKRKADRMKA